MSKKIAIHTKTQQEFNIVLEIFEKKGWEWRDGGNELKQGDKCYVSDESEEKALKNKFELILDGMYGKEFVCYEECIEDKYIRKYAVPIPKEEPKEEKPKFKVGDYAVVIGTSEYIKIVHIEDIDGHDIQYNSHLEADLRAPAQQELDTYFR